MMSGVMSYLYVFMLAAFTGYEVISRVPVILHTPLMSGTNFIHGIILIGAMVALGHANSSLEQTIGFIAVLIATINVVGGYIATERMLTMFKTEQKNGK
jgi:NAD(P) transhydrogenase subunit alpha